MLVHQEHTQVLLFETTGIRTQEDVAEALK
jgi:hypothetical protein